MARFFNETALEDLIECNRKKLEIATLSHIESIQRQIHTLRKQIDTIEWTDAIIMLGNIERNLEKLSKRVTGGLL